MSYADDALNELLDWVDKQPQDEESLRVLAGVIGMAAGNVIGGAAVDEADLNQLLRTTGELAALIASNHIRGEQLLSSSAGKK